MTDQQNQVSGAENFDNIFFDELRELLSKINASNAIQAFKQNLENENFKKNLQEILRNPNSDYAGKTQLFEELPEMLLQKKELLEELMKLKGEKENLSSEANSLKEKIEGNPEKQILGLKARTDRLEKKRDELIAIIAENDEIEGDGVKGLWQRRDDLKKEIGDEKNGLTKIRNDLKTEIDTLTKKIEQDDEDKQETERTKKFGLKGRRIYLQNEIDKLSKDLLVCNNLTELKKEAKRHNLWYCGFVVGAIILLISSVCPAYLYGSKIFSELQQLRSQTTSISVSDYIGLAILKLPFSLLIAAFIWGAFSFISKLFFVIERINNQMRNISQISVIAGRVDDQAVSFLKKSKDEAGAELTEEEKQEKNLFYKLVSDYLVNLSKNEQELRQKKEDPMKMFKEFSGIWNDLAKGKSTNSSN